MQDFERMLSYGQYPEEKSRFGLSSFKNNWSTFMKDYSTRFQAYDDIVVFCLTSHYTMNKINHGTDKRNIQELTKLSVKASIKEEKKVKNEQNIA